MREPGETQPAKPGESLVEIDIDLIAFLARYAGSPVKRDILLFFGHNPYSQDTAKNIALRIGRNASIVLRELEDLVLLGVLQRRSLNREGVYQLSDNPHLRRILPRFVAALT